MPARTEEFVRDAVPAQPSPVQCPGCGAVLNMSLFMFDKKNQFLQRILRTGL